MTTGAPQETCARKSPVSCCWKQLPVEVCPQLVLCHACLKDSTRIAEIPRGQAPIGSGRWCKLYDCLSVLAFEAACRRALGSAGTSGRPYGPSGSMHSELAGTYQQSRPRSRTSPECKTLPKSALHATMRRADSSSAHFFTYLSWCR